MKAPNRAIVTDSMFDTHAIARALTAADFTPTQADALTDAVRQAAEHDAAGVDVGTLATKADLHMEITALESAMKAHFAAKTDLAALESAMKAHFATKTDLAALEARIYRAMLVQAGAIVGALVGIAGIVVGALRLLG